MYNALLAESKQAHLDIRSHAFKYFEDREAIFELEYLAHFCDLLPAQQPGFEFLLRLHCVQGRFWGPPGAHITVT
jgi:hypothetical protein